ncbi:SAVED domain-containing protein [Sorangium sp. So ce291]|uniref:SAVED domain-containing protein n=1 Tax=Sorangium sp. So ce291 TaxID=3133294 RepID=UPI003F5E2351
MHETTDKLPNGIILLSQPEQLRVTPEDMTDALSEAYKKLPRFPVSLDEMAEVARQAIRSRDWGAAQRELEQRFRRELAPLRQQHPDYLIVYFGSAPIPLSIHLGFLLETWHQVEVVPHHHARRAWGWIAESGQSLARLSEVHLPDYKDRTPGDAVIRVSTSHLVDPQVTRRAVPEPLLEVDIALECPAEDAFTSMAEMRAVAQAFRRTLDVIGDQFPGVQCVHVFASVQPGMALLLGAQISKTMHPPVQTYQYERYADAGLYHLPAILVNGPSRRPPAPLTEEEGARAQRGRERLQDDLERMKGIAQRAQRNPVPSWIADALSRREGHPAFAGRWLYLPPLHDTPLLRTSVDVASRSVDDSFRLNPDGKWQIDDHWLACLARRMPDEDRRQRALRLLVLHESVHRGPQTLTRTSSQGVGRFPKVLEEIDYHADVWAMLYEHALTELSAHSEVEDPQRFFMNLVLAATETMWAFDDDGSSLREIQIRRLSRYLIWYWQYLHLERGTGRGAPMTLEAVLTTLAERPVIELAGPAVVARDERVFFALDTAHVKVPELAIYHAGRLHRHGTRYDFSITDLIEGVRMRDGDKILGALRGAFEQTIR